MADSTTTAGTYFRAWKDHDFETLRSILADSATFRGPLGSADTGDECVTGLQGMAKTMTDIDIKKMMCDGDDVITWYELHTDKAAPVPTVNWMTLTAGKIARIRVTFDPRPLVEG
jgi:hypothetical protein